MKEYKTLRVSPEEENNTIAFYTRFGWKLEDSREVYSESQEIVGINEKVSSYGSFMRGFTGNDGKVETQVQTRTNVTHYITLRFSRDTSIKNYDRLIQLENEFTNSEEPTYKGLLKPLKISPPILITVISLIAIIIIAISLSQMIGGETPAIWELVVCVIVGIAAILALVLSWVFYKKNRPVKIRKNEEIAQRNETIKVENKKLEEEYNARIENILAEIDEIVKGE